MLTFGHVDGHLADASRIRQVRSTGHRRSGDHDEGEASFRDWDCVRSHEL